MSSHTLCCFRKVTIYTPHFTDENTETEFCMSGECWNGDFIFQCLHVSVILHITVLQLSLYVASSQMEGKEER